MEKLRNNFVSILNQKNTRKQGDVGLGSAISYFCRMGYVVSIPLTDNQDYDLIVDINGVLKKVQVKTTRYKKPSGNFCVNLKVNGGNMSGKGKTKLFDNNLVDMLYVLTDCGDEYLIPSAVIFQKNSLSLNEDFIMYKV